MYIGKFYTEKIAENVPSLDIILREKLTKRFR